MFYEELDFLEFDHAALVKDLKERILPLGGQVVQGEDYETPSYHGFGGWSVTSQSGDWRDGWDVFHDNENDGRLDIFSQRNGPNYPALKFFGINHSLECDKPTQAYVGEFARLVDRLVSLGMYPRRVRVTCLKARAKSMVHLLPILNAFTSVMEFTCTSRLVKPMQCGSIPTTRSAMTAMKIATT
jgi:hypothetical protein